MADALTRYEGPQTVELARTQVTQARQRLSVAARGLKADLRWLRAPVAVTASMNRFPLLWLGGAFVVGAALGFLSGSSERRRDDGSE